MSNPNLPLISIWVITYNHSRFIRQCLDSILMQETSYSFEICIGEDDSNDGTREICQEYAKTHPDKIRLFLRDRDDTRRLGCTGVWQFNFIETFKACRGEFIAMCDGDDYWTDPKKLQKQVDFLQKNPSYSGCFHKISKVDILGRTISSDTGYPPHKQDSYSLDYLLRYSNFSPMFSVVFRNHDQVAPEWIRSAPFGDMIIHAVNLLHGNYGFIDEVMGAYRIHQGGLASGASRLENVRMTQKVYRLMGEHMRLKDRRAFIQGERALKLAYSVELALDTVLPVWAKQKVDSLLGKPFRARLRRILTIFR